MGWSSSQSLQGPPRSWDISLATGATLPLGIWGTELLYQQTNFSARLIFSIAIAALIFLRHRTNIVRILKGEELTFKKDTEAGEENSAQ